MKNKLKPISTLLITSILLMLGCQSTSSTSSINQQSTVTESSKVSNLERNFGYTCFTQDPQKKAEADRLYNEIERERAQISQSKFDYSIVTRINEMDQQSLAIGDPDAFLRQCWSAEDAYASRSTRNEGEAWCALGLKIIPILKTKLSKSLIAELQDLENKETNFANEIEIRRDKMCVVE
ncbi:MAG: hypothetical protein HRU38_15210 [Saccharospirillaceae bacterium]|nr:hypothetical protein [Pseudomonadales bacterium]NRB79991.1 hypothetical protein [Saccharospirillaceae bacterium]